MTFGQISLTLTSNTSYRYEKQGPRIDARPWNKLDCRGNAKMKTVIAGSLGECVHIAGVSNFLRLAEQAGWRTVFLGPAVSIDALLEAARREQADLVGVSYRLTPETGERLLGEFAEAADELRSKGVRFTFGGTPPMGARARSLGFFERVFDGTESADQVLAYLKGGGSETQGKAVYPQTALDRKSVV